MRLIYTLEGSCGDRIVGDFNAADVVEYAQQYALLHLRKQFNILTWASDKCKLIQRLLLTFDVIHPR